MLIRRVFANYLCPRRAYDRSLLHRSPGPLHPQSHSYSPRAPPTSGPRANYAWESAHRRSTGFRQPPPDYASAPPPNRPRGTTFTAGSGGGTGRHYTPPQEAYHDVLRGSRKKEEEAHREMDRIRNTSSLVRALQVMAALAASLSLMGGMGGG